MYVYKNLSLLSKSPMFSVFCLVFNRFCLRLTMFMSPLVMLYFIYLLVVFVACMFTVLVALVFFAWLYMILCIYVCICAFRLHNKGEYSFTKIFVLVNGVKGIKECNIFFFLERQSLLIEPVKFLTCRISCSLLFWTSSSHVR